MIERCMMLAGYVPLALGVWLGVTTPAVAQLGSLEGRPREAVELCFERAEDLARDRDVDDLELSDVGRAEEDDDRVEVEAEVRGRGDGGRREATMECTVNFDGDNEITEFNDDEFVDDLRREAAGGGGGDGRREFDQACRRAAERDQFDVVEITERSRDGRDRERDLRMRRNGNPWRATCIVEQGDQARLTDVERRD